MQCPVCSNSQLVMSDRQGIEIDYCPQCRGVWLDRGELDKIIERSATAVPSSAADFGRYPASGQRDERHYPHYRDKDDHYHHRKKKGFLGELFDFD